MKTCPRFAALLVAWAVCGEIRADIYRVIGKGNVIAPLRSSEIAMEAETVLVEPEKDFGGFRMKAVFTMRNTSIKSVACDVAFPFENKGSASTARESFKVTVGDGASEAVVPNIELKVREESVRTPRSAYDFAAALVWPAEWKPGEIKTIRVSYDMGEPENYSGFVDGWRLRYIVRTGALWKGPIGRADVTIRLTGNPLLGPDFAEQGGKYRSITPPFSYPANATRTSPTEVSWHFENWTPEEDIWIGKIQWIGFSDHVLMHLFLLSPPPYAGATTDYSDEMLESLTDRQLAPWRESFPEDAKRDRALLKAFVAEWLYHEIFARHGDRLHLKYKEGEPAPRGAFGRDESGDYHSVWSDKYPQAWRGGWYKPGTGPGPDGTVRLSDLTERERRNAAFLERYFTP